MGGARGVECHPRAVSRAETQQVGAQHRRQPKAAFPEEFQFLLCSGRLQEFGGQHRLARHRNGAEGFGEFFDHDDGFHAARLESAQARRTQRWHTEIHQAAPLGIERRTGRDLVRTADPNAPPQLRGGVAEQLLLVGEGDLHGQRRVISTLVYPRTVAVSTRSRAPMA